ncbi:MAG: LPS export ABC transporter periplasmic protein LptC [Candidatus Eremiobacteraeota bacterium]|nr:LPS export ABC transporter periplasmic protein LptC [Candidatus Eremiobacteraeota bacterium]
MRYRAAALFCLAAAGCNPSAPKPTAAPSLLTRPRATPTPLVLKITGYGTAKQPVHLIQQVHNRVDYDLLASSYQSNGPQGAARAVFQSARVTFRDRTGATFAATAPQAVVDQAANTVTLTNGVHAHTSSGMTLECTQLVYERATGMLHGSGDVVVTDPKGFRATGSSFDSDISLTHMRMQ